MKRSIGRFATAGLGALAVASALVAGAGTAAHAATAPPYEPTAPNEVGTLSFESSTGAAVTTGTLDADPFAAYAVGSATVEAGDTQAALFICLPQVGVDPADWTCGQLSSYTHYPVTGTGVPISVSGATTPVATLAAGEPTIDSFVSSHPNTTGADAGYYQLRLRTAPGTPSNDIPSTDYDAADISVSGSSYVQSYPSASTGTATTTTLTASPASGDVGGGTVTLAATVSPTEAGSVEFLANGVELGSSAVGGTPTTASLTTSSIPVGTDALTAVFTPTDTSDVQPSTGTLSYTVNHTAAGPGSFVSVTPTRILDTRNAIGVSSTTPIKAGGTVQLQVTQTATDTTDSPVPAGASAVVMNVGVVSPAAGGIVQIYPGPDVPNVASIGYQKGVNLANLVVVPLTPAPSGTDTVPAGQVTLKTSAQTHLIADVSGYIMGGSSTVTEVGGLQTVDPARILDTRNAIGVTTKTPAKANVPVTLQVTKDSTNTSPIPAGASAVVMNVGVVNPAAGGILQVYPGTKTPTVASIGYQKNVNLANEIIVPLTSSGTVTLLSSAQADLIGDVSGYIVGSTSTPPAIATAEGAFVPVVPDRILDTRNKIGIATSTPIPAGGTVPLQVTGVATIPGGAQAAVLNVGVVNPAAGGIVQVYPGTTVTNTAAIGYQKDVNLASGVIAPLTTGGETTLKTSAATHLIADVSAYVIG